MKDKFTYKAKCRYLLKKYPHTKYSRASFMWQFIQEFVVKGEDYCYNPLGKIDREQFFRFFKHFSSVERALRYVLKEDNFRLKKKEDRVRYRKASEFQREYKI